MDIDANTAFITAIAGLVTAFGSVIAAFNAKSAASGADKKAGDAEKEAGNASSTATEAERKATQADRKAAAADAKAEELQTRLKQTEILLPVYAEYKTVREVNPDDKRWSDPDGARRLVEQVRTNLNAMQLMAEIYMRVDGIPGDIVESMFSDDFRSRVHEIDRIVAMSPYRLGAIGASDKIWEKYRVVHDLNVEFLRRVDAAARGRIVNAKTNRTDTDAKTASEE